MIDFHRATADNTNLGIGGGGGEVVVPKRTVLIKTHSSYSHHHPRKMVCGAQGLVIPSSLCVGVTQEFSPMNCSPLLPLSYRCQSRIVRTLPTDQKPECRPYWEKDDPSMPLPFDLTDTVSELKGLLLGGKP